MTSIPDFFQDESEGALRCQVEWQTKHLALGDGFFAKFLREDTRIFCGWRKDTDALTEAKLNVLRDWWQTVLHLLSFQNFDEEKVRLLLQQVAPTVSKADPSLFAPPWSASSMKDFLESYGPDAIQDVNRWVGSFRFGDPYRPSRKDNACLSTQT